MNEEKEFDKINTVGVALIIAPVLYGVYSIVTCPPSQCSPIISLWVLGALVVALGIYLVYSSKK